MYLVMNFQPSILCCYLFVSGIYTISIFKSSAKTKKFFNIGQLFEAWLWMLSIPLVISIVKSLIFGFCSFWDGLFFYLIITCPSVIIGSAIGAISFHFVKKFRVILYIFIYLLILLIIPILEIYFNPQIYLFNPLFAYFPGTIYDEGITVDLNLALYRIFNLIFFLSILKYFVGWSRKEISFNKRISFLILTIFISGLFYFFVAPSLGYTTTDSCLRNALSNRIESKHFIIQADKSIGNDELKLIVLNQEFYYSRLSEFFLDKPGTKIKSYIFFDSEQKQKLFGAGSADVAKPWLNSIYVSADTWESTLKHEIAHCFTAGFGTGIFKLASGFNPALIEGVAEAADGFYDENSIHFLASLAYKNDYRVNLNSMMSSFSFFSSVSTISYIYSGSFIKYLVDHYGIGKVKDYYRSNDFNKSFAVDLDSTIKSYESFLDTLTISSTEEKSNYYFGRKSLISKVCPRYVASSLGRAFDYYASKDFLEAEIIFEDILLKAECYGAVVGLSKIYEEQDSLSKAIKLLESNLKTFSGISSEYDLKFRLADLYVKASELEKASELYSFLLNAKPNIRLELVSNIRLALLKKGTITDYVSGSDYDRYETLKELNLKSYNYSSFPLMIDLSQSLDEDYQFFKSHFVNDIEVKDEISSYAVLKLSEYMLQNFDFVNARKMAGISLRYKGNQNLLRLTEENFDKSIWFFKNADVIVSETNF